MIKKIKNFLKYFFPVTIKAFNRTIEQISGKIDLKYDEGSNQVKTILDKITDTQELCDKLLIEINTIHEDIQNQSLHLEQNSNEQISKVEQNLNEQISKVEQNLNEQMSKAQQKRNETIHVYDYFNKAMLWQIYRNSGESFDEERQRFYLNLPKAEGNLRLIQLSELYLIRELDKVCRENDLQYWLHGGSLLGAVRHKGFIPWDDDMDVGMMRFDIERLKKILESHATIYLSELFDYYPTAMCRQFRLRFKDNRIPSFVDVFIFDHCQNSSQENWMQVQSIRHCMAVELNSIIPQLKTYQSDKFITDEVDTTLIETVYQKYNDKARMQTAVCNEDADCIIWAIDNADNYPLEKNYSFNVSDIFPLVDLKFDGTRFYAPKNYEKYLRLMYGNYLDFPQSLLNFEHVPKGQFESSEVVNLLNDIIG